MLVRRDGTRAMRLSVSVSVHVVALDSGRHDVHTRLVLDVLHRGGGGQRFDLADRCDFDHGRSVEQLLLGLRRGHGDRVEAVPLLLHLHRETVTAARFDHLVVHGKRAPPRRVERHRVRARRNLHHPEGTARARIAARDRRTGRAHDLDEHGRQRGLGSGVAHRAGDGPGLGDGGARRNEQEEEGEQGNRAATTDSLHGPPRSCEREPLRLCHEPSRRVAGTRDP